MKLENNLRVFLSYASEDYKKVKKHYRQLIEYGFDAWLDKEDISPGHNWDFEVRNAIDISDAIVIFLSNNLVNKEGYIQKEVLMVLDKTLEKPLGVLFLFPVQTWNNN